MKSNEQTFSGQALLEEDLTFSPVDIFIRDGIITAIEENPDAPPTIICPALFDAHTHLGDTIAMDCGATGDLASLVTPPDGLKHRLLAAATRPELIAGMRASLEGMARSGIAGCADFREGGREGVIALSEASWCLPVTPLVFGRDGGEMIADGLGISSTRDVHDVERQVQDARRAGKLIAFHAGERDPGDVDAALAFDPDLIIHATHATKKQLRHCADHEIPIAVCPRSNWILGVAGTPRHPPLRLMQECGCRILLGTDNVMFVPPDLFSEMAFVSTLYGLEPREILRSAVSGSELTGNAYYIRPGAPANLFEIGFLESALRFSRDPLATLVKRAIFANIGKNVFNSKLK
ncbi:amidohydrolase [uncultured Methanoregula sp.]|uniref:amidohydrolase n=1 Tax=uncultured Methanoregula sp. TaxID=1005933 RepID=UPI002AAA6841|nr:amidohydrolase [uncultured Methanoregula sp.]